MRTRNAIRPALVLLVAALGTGCGPLREFRARGTTPPPAYSEPYPEPGAAEPVPGGKVVAASGLEQPPPMPPPRPPYQPQPYPLPQPQPYPHVQPGAPAPLPYPYGPPSGFADPHYRTFPTVTGRALELRPDEMPIERVVALTKQIESVLAQNAQLAARVKELEALAVGREQALAEATREIDTITADAAKAKLALMAQLAALQAQLKKYEDDDILFLEAALKLLKKIAEQQGVKP